MPTTLVTGASGTLGSALCPQLVSAGHEVRAASRSPPTAPDERAVNAADGATTGELQWIELDLTADRGLDDVLADVDVVIHAASDAVGDTEAVDIEGTKRLLAAADAAAVSNVVYISIVGIEDIPYSYYEAKRAAESAIEASAVPATILRATQFHAFIDELLGYLAKLPVWPIPTRFQVQPVAAEEVAARMVEYATPAAHGRIPSVGGPDVHTLGDLARAYREARGMRRPIVRLPVPGAIASGFRAGHNTCPDRAVGTMTWAEWLGERYA